MTPMFHDASSTTNVIREDATTISITLQTTCNTGWAIGQLQHHFFLHGLMAGAAAVQTGVCAQRGPTRQRGMPLSESLGRAHKLA